VLPSMPADLQAWLYPDVGGGGDGGGEEHPVLSLEEMTDPLALQLCGALTPLLFLTQSPLFSNFVLSVLLAAACPVRTAGLCCLLTPLCPSPCPPCCVLVCVRRTMLNETMKRGLTPEAGYAFGQSGCQWGCSSTAVVHTHCSRLALYVSLH